MADDLVIDAPDGRRITLPASDLEWSASRSSGPGGQHVNKTATKVDLRFDLAGTAALDEQVKRRLRRLARNRLDADGCVVIQCQASRSQSQNLEEARQRLKVLVLKALERPRKRKRTKPSRAAKRRRLERKRRQSRKKALRRKVDPNTD
jgi:ribosome-associated protein